MEEPFSDHGRACKRDWERIGIGWSWIQSEEDEASEWTWNEMENPHISKIEGEGVTNPASREMEEEGKKEPEVEGAQVDEEPCWKQHLEANPGIPITAATEAIRQLHENESDQRPAKESSEQSNPWITQSITPRELEGTEHQLAHSPEVLPATSPRDAPALIKKKQKMLRRMVRGRRQKVLR